MSEAREELFMSLSIDRSHFETCAQKSGFFSVLIKREGLGRFSDDRRRPIRHHPNDQTVRSLRLPGFGSDSNRHHPMN